MKKIPIFLRIVLDFILLLVVGLPILILFLVGQPFERGFNCDDESIMYPYKESTISNTCLYCVGIIIPAFVILATELVRFVSQCEQNLYIKNYKFLRWDVHPFIWQIYRKLGVFLFGAALSQLTTDIAKYTIGRLRPHFLAVCNPSINCNLIQYQNRYIENGMYTCENEDKVLIREARLSFMSGHSSFSAYTMLFTALYLQSRMTYTQVKLLRPFLQALCLWAAWGTALSRISDYKHHWSDVMAGSIQGVIVALIVVYFFSDLFTKPAQPKTILNKDTTNYNSCALDQRS